MNSKTETGNRGVLNYKAFRLLIAFLAFSIPIVVWSISTSELTSISASYYTEARDIFIGLLFFVGAFLGVYNGHLKSEAYASRMAAFAIILVAIFPTSCEICDIDIKTRVHYISAGVFFLVLMYFCFGPFRKHAKAKKGGENRSKIYFVCGTVILVCILTMLVNEFVVFISNNLLFIAETIALWAFGTAWFVAGRYRTILPV